MSNLPPPCHVQLKLKQHNVSIKLLLEFMIASLFKKKYVHKYILKKNFLANSSTIKLLENKKNGRGVKF